MTSNSAKVRPDLIALVYIVQFIFRPIFLLPAGMAIILIRLFSRLIWAIAKLTPIRRNASNNFKLVFPKKNPDQLADRLLWNVAATLIELICAPFFNKAHLDRIARITGLENLDQAMANRRGALLLSMHTGNYELTANLFGIRGYNFTAIYKSADNPLIDLLNKSRVKHGTRLINVDAADMYKESIKALANNEMIGILIDTGALEGRHEMIDFVGHKVPVATGWLTLAQRSGAAVLPVFNMREGDTVHMIIDKPLYVFSDNRDEIKEKVRLFYENFIKNHPDQWAIFLNSYETKRMVGK